MTQAQDTATRLGSTLGPYRLEERLGRTETGDIYRAEDCLDGTPWLVKLVHAELCAMPGFRAALRQQAMFLSALEHPHIAQVARIDEAGERCFIAMGWQPDGTLRRLLGRRGSLAEDLPLAVDLAAQIAEGLAFAHEQGFVHGSLSPEDMLLSRRDDGGYSLKISDFGLAWLLLDYGVDAGPWDDSLVYALTPERCRGLEPDARGDQYALGAILYELVTGCAPYSAATLDDAVAGHVYGQPVLPRALVPHMPAELEAIILRCLAKSPDDRFADTGDLARALRGLGAGGWVREAVPADAGDAGEADAPAPEMVGVAGDAGDADTPVEPKHSPAIPAAVGAIAAANALALPMPGADDVGDALVADDAMAVDDVGDALAADAAMAADDVGDADTPTPHPPSPTPHGATFAAPSRYSWAPPVETVDVWRPAPAPAPAPPPIPDPRPPTPAPQPPAPIEDDLEALLKTPVRQFEPTDLIGEVVAGYRIETFLGPTETGPVYQARRQGADGPRALKIMSSSLTQDRGFRRRFHERKETIQSLRHAHIVSIEAIGEEAGLCYVAVEWLPDGTLRNLMQRRGSAAWSLPMALDLARQAADAMSFAHKQGFIHSSIKPNNLVLARRADGQSGYTLKVTDFGLAALLIDQDGALDDVWGDSLIYALSPERCRGQELDGRSDQYALGVILYEMATGSVPFEAKTLDAAVFRHVYTAPVPPRDMIPEIPANLEAIILRCLAKSPADRFPDASDLATALQDLLRSPAMAPTLSFTPRPAGGGVGGLVRRAGPVIPRVQALDQYGRALATRDLTGDGLTVGRDPRNAIILDGDEIEPSHLEMDWDGSAILVTSLATGATVIIGDAAMRPRETRVWHWDEPMRLGTFWLRVEPMPLSSAGPAAPAPAPAFASDAFGPASGGPAPVVIALPTADGRAAASGSAISIPPDPGIAPAAPPDAAPAEMLTDRIGIILDQESLTLTPGRPATFRMTLVNLGSIVDHFKVAAEGVPEAWIVGQAPQVQLNPGAKDLVTLNILVPQVPESHAREYPVTIRARSRENPRESNTADALWTVLPFASSSFDLRPKKRSRLLKGLYRVQVNNQGNAPVTYNLSAADDEEALGFLFGDERMTLAPGAVGRTDLQVRPNQKRWFGQPVQHRFSVLAKPAGQGETHNSSAQLAQLVFFPRWLLLLLLLLLLLGLLLAWFLYLPKIITFSTLPPVPVAGDPFAVRWNVTNGPLVELRVNQTPVPVPPGATSIILAGQQSPPLIELLARNQVFGRDSGAINVSLIAPSPTFTNTPTPVPTLTPVPPTPIPPPTLAPTEPPTPTVPSATPTITPTPTSQALCEVNGTLTLTGSGPPRAPLVVYFDGRPVGGGLTDAAGRFSIVLGRFREQPGRYPLTVEVRSTNQVLLFLTCIVPTPVPLETNTPTATSATPATPAP